MKLFLLAICLGVATAHVCLLEPEQRGGLAEGDLNTEFSGACDVLKFPCGNAVNNPIRSEIVVGQPFTVIFQKNNNHYNSHNPGFFNITLFIEHKAPKTLICIPDTNTPAFHLYAEHPTVSASEIGDGFIQVSYTIDSSSNQYIYYQCADVHVKSN